MSHTPGPWNANLTYPTEQATSGIAITNGSLDLTTVKGLLEITDAYYGTVALTNCKANARLIAAAPELLQCAKCALADLEGILPEFETSGDKLHPGWQTLKELKTIIHKATGEPS